MWKPPRQTDRRQCPGVLVALLLLSLTTRQAVSQPAGERPAVASQAEVFEPPNRIRRRLTQLDALLAAEASAERAGESWAEAIELLQSLTAEESARVAVVEASPGYFISLAEHCHTLIAGLPPEALARYRAAVDPQARRLYEQGVQRRDAALLARVVDESFCSTWGDDALLALGEMALERGDTAGARRCWRRVHPLLSDPGGRPLAWALNGVDLAEHGDTVLRRLEATPRVGGWLVYPDSDLPIADLLTRMAVAAIIAGDPATARREIAWLRTVSPGAEGLLAGRRAPLADALRSLLDAEADGGALPSAEKTGPLIGRLWPHPRPLDRRQAVRLMPDPFGRLRRQPIDVDDSPPTVTAAAWGRSVVLRDGDDIVAVDLLTGLPAVTRRGSLYRASRGNAEVGPRAAVGWPANALRRNGLGGGPMTAADAATEPVTVVGDRLFARVVGEPVGAAASPGSRIRVIGRDLARQNLAVLELKPPDEPWSFGGPPVVVGDRLYIAVVAADVRPRVGVACYSSVSGRAVWQTPIASGQPPSGADDGGPPAYAVVPGGDAIYLNTNLGVVAALEAFDGAVRWVSRYRQTVNAEAGGRATADTAPRCAVLGDRLYAAPRDADHSFAFDTATGRPLWQSASSTGGAALLGVDRGVLVLAGRRVTGIDADDGALRYRWPESLKAGLRGMGRGCLVDGEVFWPTRGRLFVLDAVTGAPTRGSVDVADLGGSGVNVTPAAGCLIVAGADAVTVLGPIDREQTDLGPRLSQATRPDETLAARQQPLTNSQ